jgi:hypothetical protein
MFLIAIDICAISYVSMERINVLSIVLLSLLLPIIYFYTLFDSLHSTDTVNDRSDFRPGWPTPEGWDGMAPSPAPGPFQSQPDRPMAHFSRNIPAASLLFLGAAAVIIFVMADVSWTHWLTRSSGSMIGAVVLIGVGVVLWFWEMRSQRGGKG